MSTPSETWIERTAALYRALSDHEEAPTPRGRRRLSTFLDLAMSERVREVGADQGLHELRQVIHRALVDKY